MHLVILCAVTPRRRRTRARSRSLLYKSPGIRRIRLQMHCRPCVQLVSSRRLRDDPLLLRRQAVAVGRERFRVAAYSRLPPPPRWWWWWWLCTNEANYMSVKCGLSKPGGTGPTETFKRFGGVSPSSSPQLLLLLSLQPGPRAPGGGGGGAAAENA